MRGVVWAGLARFGSDVKKMVLAAVAMVLAVVVCVLTAGSGGGGGGPVSVSALTFPEASPGAGVQPDPRAGAVRLAGERGGGPPGAGDVSICRSAPQAAAVVGLSGEQGRNAATIAAVARERGLPERAVVVGLATAMQESQLENLGYGDRDSLGLFQQRPSQGWGSAEQVTDPRYAAGRFYDGLAAVPGWQEQPVTVAAQQVQQSGFPEAYAQWEDEASTLAQHLTGATPQGTACH